MRTRDTDKEQLVKEKAIDMFVTDGFEGFSMNKLAKACNISVATLYIYYKDKEDLIINIAREEMKSMSEAILKNFDTEASFEQGLREQWKSRSTYMLGNQKLSIFFDQLRSSNYQDQAFGEVINEFKRVMGRFMKNAVERGEIEPLPLEVYWSVAFAPLYNLITFHYRGESMAKKPFRLTDKILWQTFDLVIKALKK
jgi:AcrR family transcriptional regulator